MVSGLKAGHTYKITASTDNTYAKTLTGVVKVNADDSPLCAPEADGKVQSEAEFTDSFLPETTQESTPESGEEAGQEEVDLEDLSESSEDTEPVECEMCIRDRVREGDVIAFFDPAGNGRSVVTHRVRKITKDEDGNLAWVTKGDANNTEDQALVPAENLVDVYKRQHLS